MPTTQTLLAFAIVSAGIMVIPGPSNFFLLAHGIGHGRRSALAAMTGIEMASAVRVLLTAAGLSAALAASAVALNVIRWAGAAYLAYLGVRAFRQPRVATPAQRVGQPVPVARSARKGLLVGLGNPKMVIFFISFFPAVHPPRRRLRDRLGARARNHLLAHRSHLGPGVCLRIRHDWRVAPPAPTLAGSPAASRRTGLPRASWLGRVPDLHRQRARPTYLGAGQWRLINN